MSVIMHPRNPFAPSMHLHVSYMQPRGARAPGPLALGPPPARDRLELVLVWRGEVSALAAAQ